MPNLTIVRISGNPRRLLDGYRQTSELMDELGHDHGLILHAGAPNSRARPLPRSSRRRSLRRGPRRSQPPGPPLSRPAAESDALARRDPGRRHPEV
jgi:hypothetical protein